MILKSFVLVEKDCRYLLIKEAAKKWDGKWFLPGGKVELNETIEHAAHRETKEEAGCDVNINGIFYFRFTQGFLDRHLSIFFTASIAGEETIKHVADKHSLEAKWFTLEEINGLSVRQNLLEIIKSYDKEKIIPVKNFKIL